MEVFLVGLVLCICRISFDFWRLRLIVAVRRLEIYCLFDCVDLESVLDKLSDGLVLWLRS